MPFIKLKNIKEKEIVPGYKARFIHSENMTIASWNIKKGYSLPEHSHHHEQLSCVTEGEFELIVNGEKQILNSGKIAVIPSNAKHSGKAITDCKIIDIFNPVREDYK
jgi:quercetin dioxygenase-like cupin family protein